MGISKLKAALQNALKDGNKKIADKTKDKIRQKREWKPPFDGAHRGY